MPYAKQVWADGSAGGTPINASRLNYMENGIANAIPKDSRTTLARRTLTAGQSIYAGLPISAGLAVGSRFRITLSFSNPATAATQAIAIRFGSAGSVSDAAVQTVTCTGTAAADKARLTFEVQVDSIAASTGAISAQSMLQRNLENGTTGFHNVAGATSRFADAQITNANTAATDRVLGVSIATSVASTTVLLGGVIERIW